MNIIINIVTIIVVHIYRRLNILWICSELHFHWLLINNGY